MKRKGWPIWLLRDIPAFLGVMLSFWPLVILLISSERRVMRGKVIRRSVFETIALLLAHAEARLTFALTRQAYRRLGWNPRLVRFNLIPATDNLREVQERYANYANAFGDMNAVVEAYIEDIRQRYRISEREAAIRSCPLRHATASRATSPGYAEGGNAHSSLSSIAARRGRWLAASSRRDGGGSRKCRGPPTFSAHNLLEPTSQASPARTLTRLMW